jgi:hypothetical protein
MKNNLRSILILNAASCGLATSTPHLIADLPPVEQGFVLENVTVSNLPLPPDQGVANLANVVKESKSGVNCSFKATPNMRT